ncbi:MAG: hypothetical protein HQ517_04265 [SAR324 cluster bacterium]|nr:hypothetical protein [SAR324 cluster bacterium]
MERHPFGMNFDEGLPLKTDDDFKLLYVNITSNPLNRLLDWLQTKQHPLLFGGQIGSGKSTLIEKALKDSDIQPDVTIHFDYDVLNGTTGSFLGLVLAEVVRLALDRKADLSFSKFPSELISGSKAAHWKDLLEVLTFQDVSLKSIKRVQSIEDTITEDPDYVVSVIDQIVKELLRISDNSLFLFASGIDKFGTDTPAWFSIQPVLKFLSRYKTLFEVNSIHLLQDHENWMGKCERIAQTSCDSSEIELMLAKRLGNYAETRKDIIPLIAAESGGNPRQALRLLTAQEFAVNKLKKSDIEAYTLAVQRVTNDFFTFGKRPEIELLSAIDRRNAIESSLLNLPGDKETARTAVFGNWILLQSEPVDGTAWPAVVNPLVKKALSLKINPDEPEVSALKKYAEQQQISANGLSFDLKKIQDGEFWRLYMTGILEKPISANITEILDILSAALLSKDRQDRIIIAYQDKDVLEAARAYIFGKANSFEYQTFEHMQLDADKDPFIFLKNALKKDSDILSFDFAGDWSKEQLTQLDKYRDLLLEKQIIWWIPIKQLSFYLSKWLHLRQLFQVLVLEDELLNSLNEEDIQADIEFFTDLMETDESPAAKFVENLTIVLNYLQKRRST